MRCVKKAQKENALNLLESNQNIDAKAEEPVPGFSGGWPRRQEEQRLLLGILGILLIYLPSLITKAGNCFHRIPVLEQPDMVTCKFSGRGTALTSVQFPGINFCHKGVGMSNLKRPQ